MRYSIAWLPLLAFLLAATFAPASATTPQQQLMKTCNAQAGSQKLSGDERKHYMSDCLGGKTVAAAPTHMTQQDKMKSCNVQASGQKLMGDARRSFMSGCLRG
jgi:psiF repeat